MTVAPAPYFTDVDVTIYNADARDAWRWLPEHSVDAIITSPPYFGLRDYGVDGQIGLEQSPADYVEQMADLLTAYGTSVLREDGSLWLNLGDTYNNRVASRKSSHQAGLGFESDDLSKTWRELAGEGRARMTHKSMPEKCLLMIPERVALALIERGWILRNKVIWAKSNGMPASVTDRLACKWEYLFHFTRAPRYYYDLDAIREPHAATSVARASRARSTPGPEVAAAHFGNPPSLHPSTCDLEAGVNPGDVWTIPTAGYHGAHFAVYPQELVRRPILATVPEGGTLLDMFLGSGTTAAMARRLGNRHTIGIELNPESCALAAQRLRQPSLLADLNDVTPVP